jgi:hypothetical protein
MHSRRQPTKQLGSLLWQTTNIAYLITGAPSLFLPANKTTNAGANVQILLEVQAVNAAGDKQRSWFVGDDKVIGGEKRCRTFHYYVTEHYTLIW